MVDKHPLTPPNSNLSVALEFVNHAFAESRGKRTFLASVRPVTYSFGFSFFWIASSLTADFGTSTITGKKCASLRKSSGMSEAATDVRFSSRKRTAFGWGSVLGCAKGETGYLIAVAIEIPLSYRSVTADPV